MKYSAIAAFIATVGITAVQSTTIPACAEACFLKAVGETNCKITDYYCQCTSGQKVIQAAALKCICEDSTCTSQDLISTSNVYQTHSLIRPSEYFANSMNSIEVGQATNQICESAVSASHQTFTPATIPADVCAATGGAGTASSTAATNTAATTGATATGSGASAATSSAAAQSGNAATPNAQSFLGLESALLGLAGVLMLAL